MYKTEFFPRSGPFPISKIIELTGIIPADNISDDMMIHGIEPLDRAGEGDITFIDNPKYREQLEKTQAFACLVAEKFTDRVPKSVLVLKTDEPYRAFAKIAALFYPDAMCPRGNWREDGVAIGSHVHPSASLGKEVIIEPGAVIGADVEIGDRTIISAGAVLGEHVKIGTDNYIGPNVTILNSYIGNRVILHGGVSIGQDGFGFAMSAKGHLKVPQIGRVIIQDDVEIGSGSCIDRGTNRDTVVGEGTKIDNLVQIGHGVQIGRHCIIVGQTGISGSTILQDFVVLGGQVGVIGHITIGMGAQIAASSNVHENVPAGAKWGGTPAKPAREWFREMTTLKKLANTKKEL